MPLDHHGTARSQGRGRVAAGRREGGTGEAVLMTADYRSSVLRCNVEEDGCQVCEFLNGARDANTLLEVIRILDAQLAKEEK